MVLRFLYLLAKSRSVHAFIRGAARARQTQREILLEKIRRESASDFGRRHGFPEIRGVEDFRRRLPIASYEYFRPYVDRVKCGETGALFGPSTRVLMFSVTSGTTGDPKYIPITNHFFREYRRGWNIWGTAVFRDHIDLIRKKTLQFSSDWQESSTESGIPSGNVSGLAAETRPPVARMIFMLPAVLNKVQGTLNKQYVALRLAIHHPRVGMIVTANPLTLLNLARLADDRKESLIRDCYNGTIASDIEVPALVRDQLRGRLGRRRVAGARRLETIVERTGRLLPRDFWPRMSVLAVWTGGSMSGYLDRVKEIYGDVVFRDHGLSASEGRMTTPFGDGNRAGFLDYTTHYFEFMPVRERESRAPIVLEGHELEIGEDYYILLTTSSGLYRYDIHDVVRCVDRVGTCPLLEFLHKGAHFSSMAGEKLSEYQVVEAITTALHDSRIRCEHFTLAAQPGDPPRYCLLLDEELDPRSGRELARQVDARLAQLNCEYRDRLASHRLGPVDICRVPRGAWDRLRAARLAENGGSFEQYKHPFLVSDARVVECLGRSPAQDAAALMSS